MGLILVTASRHPDVAGPFVHEMTQCAQQALEVGAVTTLLMFTDGETEARLISEKQHPKVKGSGDV
jgi:hypothetical protein